MVNEALENDSEIEEGDLEEGDEESSPSRRRISGKKIVLFVVAPLLLVIGGGAGVYFSGLANSFLPGGEQPTKEQVEAKPKTDAIFFEVPELLVNLNNKGRRSSFLKIRVALEIENADQSPQLEKLLPRIVDNFQIYLRELRMDDLRGSAGMQRLREELLLRVNTAVEPIRVNDVLFKEMLVQ